jgi:hypothetical protein
MVMLITRDVTLTSSDYANWAGKGELLVIGIPDANGKQPRITATGVTPFNWQSTSGNLALVNLIDPGEIAFGSGHNPQKQTLTLIGITQTHGPARLILTHYEGGGGVSAPDPTLPIDDEVYFKNVLVKAGPNSHNVYLDRNGLHYIEGLISYGNACDGCHPLKLDGRTVFLYGSWLGSAGVHANLPGDNSGQTPLSSVACQVGVIRGNKFLDAVGATGGIAAAAAQIRVAIAGCDWPLGFQSNSYPTSPYTGPVTYRGTYYPSTPFWNRSWWESVRARGVTPPALYSNPDMLVTYYLDNTFEVLINGDQNPSNYYGLVTQPTFPTSYPSSADSNTPRMTNAAPPTSWFERARLVVANNCFRGGNSAKVLNHWPPRMSCSDREAPPWVRTWPACTDGQGFPDETNKFVMIGHNQCDVTDPVPSELNLSIANLEKIPNPPWRTWLR